MNKSLITAFFCILLPLSVAQADDVFTLQDLGEIHQEPVDPNDPCTILFCMGGMLSGSKDKECQPAINTFFSIKKYGRHGFDAWKTFTKRRGKLDSCPTGDDALKSKVLDTFGRMKG
ncbi:hypothetical protein C6652_23090 [Salmonella enterica]|uniref:TrbM/KikA/MpfK family conjugal transfer protein n=1 Tax=Citrobacter freundii TaxID=546 RepID=UPI00127F04C5|nr:TrbM/KikA/MpfK family conjugal transfer protein [Citrobacter freundii]EAT6622114.1 hypothetical protein [Salmonella enterica]ECM0368673.1 hypothetical protein [Salmonella enterica subsp. enterica serovar Infantis]ECU1104642.1 hypothetical protein [Salmonella enterica subsp. enterica]EEH8382900.1 hypothetical protein [Salmonella enterica subsp. enterica serovar Montevideo]MDM8704369.1 TrbM/KikA/MpfK family conjugal transfer protein [Escherichia coli]